MKTKWVVYAESYTSSEGMSKAFESKIAAALYGAKLLRSGWRVYMKKEEYEHDD